MKKVLILGAGLVTRPHVKYLLGVPEFHVTVASRTVSKAQTLVEGHANGTAVQLDVTDEAGLRELIAKADLAVSMLPYVYHPVVARLCIELGKDMVTTSYVSEAMQALDGQARAAGVLILNEIGVDPGIDHMSAMQVIHGVQNEGGQIVSFKSNTGGLPAPEANTNPLGYKFSWSPRGVLLAGKNAARWREDGQEINVPGEELFDNYWPMYVDGLGWLECYPNRDSLPYLDIYGIPDAETIFRGTLRYTGWCQTLRNIVEAGWVNDESRDLSGLTYGQLTAQLMGTAGENVGQEAVEHLGIAENSYAFYNMKWLGLFSDQPLAVGKGSPLDVLVNRMLSKMQYDEGERDMIVMQHEFIARYPDRREKITATMIDFGVPDGDTSMARTVGLPAAIATRMILQGEVQLTGVHRPVMPEIYDPVMEELKTLDIGFEEKTETLTP
jgi:saccharopine dehydrogenase-like NADP-dependent oxidoreductase